MDEQGQVISSKKYEGPMLAKEWAKLGQGRRGDGYPTYLDGEGRVYDAFYQRCPPAIEQRVAHELLRDAPFPSLADSQERYPSFFDYEEAMLEWKMRVEAAISTVQLPRLLGRAYPRPRVVMHVWTSSGDRKRWCSLTFCRRNSLTMKPRKNSAITAIVPERWWLLSGRPPPRRRATRCAQNRAIWSIKTLCVFSSTIPRG